MTLEELARKTLPINCPWFIRPDSPTVLRISAEHPHSSEFLSYYGRHYPWINPVLENWATDYGGYWEWENPSNIGFYSLY